jgi:hypothetical protein
LQNKLICLKIEYMWSEQRPHLQGLLILGEVDALVVLELPDEVVHDALVEVVAPQVRVPGRGQNLKDAVAHLQDCKPG